MTRSASCPKSFTQARRSFVDGSSTPRDFLESCLARIEEREPAVKAFKFLDVAAARDAADLSTKRYRDGRALSFLDGCPVGIKDIIETADMPTGFGSPAFEGNQTRRDAACVQALRKSGAIIAGKTVTTEFAIGFSGATTNAHDATRTPGGSSSGSAASVGAGMLPVALGTQTNGSMLRPASYNGVCGYKGTFGSLPLAGVHPVSTSHDHLGIFASDLDDLWATASCISGTVGSPGHAPLHGLSDAAPKPRKPRRLIRLHLSAWNEVEEAHRQVFEDEVRRLGKAGVEILDRTNSEHVRRLEEQLDRDVAGSSDIVAYDMRWPFADYVERFGRMIGDRIHGIVERTWSISPDDYKALLQKRQAAQVATSRTLLDVQADAFVMPAASGPAPKGFEFTGSRAYLVYWSWLGFPAFSVPTMEADGMPWGLQVMHIADRDDELCSVAGWLLETAQAG